jgi:enterochelin esterase-like enzyme
VSLLGTPLLVVLCVACLLVPVAAILLWQRCHGPRAVRVMQRIGLVLLCQLTALMAAGAAINDYAYFFSSWSELAGIARQQVAAAPAQSQFDVQYRAVPTHLNPASAGRIDVLHDYPFASRAQWPSRGRVLSVTIEGAVSGLRSHAYVYLPPQYFQARYAHTRFPALEVMTGYPGVDLNLVHRMGYQSVLLDLIRRHESQPMVLVMLRPSVTYPRDTECTDVPAGPQALTFFADDVPAQLAYAYRVRATGWGIVGDSTGGYCAAKITMMRPSTFSAAVALSGYYFALRDSTTQDLWGGSVVVRHLNDLHWRLKHLPAPPVSVLVASSPSEKGADGWAEAQRFVHEVKPPMRVSTLVVAHGGHNFTTWDAELPAALSWLSQHVPPVAG